MRTKASLEAVMDHFRLLLSSIFLLLIVEASHANLEPRMYWRTILPHITMPSAIEKLLQPDVTHDWKASTSVNLRTSKFPLFYSNYAVSDTQLQDDPTVALFFLRKELHPAKNFTLQLADKTTATNPGFIPRSAAESIPFSAADFPSILSRLSISVASAEATAAEQTLSDCEAAPPSGETKLCSTSLESMVDFAMMSLGTPDVVAVETDGGSTASERVAYKVGSVRKVAAAGGKVVVVCHPMEYAYAVFFCHSTTTTEVYEVEMIAVENGGTAVKAVAVCHTDTAGWNPRHLAFRVLKVKPGTEPACHFLPQDQVVWVEKV